MAKWCVLALLLIVPARASAQVGDGKVLHATLWTHVALQGADSYLTLRGLTTPGITEQGRLTAHLYGDNPRWVAPVKIGGGIATALLLKATHADHPKATLWTAIAA